MKLIPVGKEKGAVDILYRLLSEREPSESISHRSMPTLAEHRKFVRSNPYQVWYLIQIDHVYVGACYISKQREIGIGIFKEHRRKGHAAHALQTMMSLWPGRFIANINPENKKSVALFAELGFKHIQNTYERGYVD